MFGRGSKKGSGGAPLSADWVVIFWLHAEGLERLAVKQDGLSFPLRIDKVEVAPVRACDKTVASIVNVPVPVIPHVGQIKNRIRTHASLLMEVGHVRENIVLGLGMCLGFLSVA